MRKGLTRADAYATLGNDTGTVSGIVSSPPPQDAWLAAMSARSTITIRHVAKAAGVSVSTVSRVLNDKEDVSPATYAKVQAIIEQLGYSSSLAARSLRSRTTHAVGVVIIDLSDPFSIEVVRGIGAAIHDLGYDLIVYSSGRLPARTQAGWEQRPVARLNGGIADGVILVTPTTGRLPKGFPLVTIDAYEDDGDVPSILSTNYEGARAVMDYLVALGHHRIGYIGGRPGVLSAIERQRGYWDGLLTAQLPSDLALMCEGDFTRETGNRCACQLLTLPDRPTAIFAANDRSAMGVLDAARNAHLRVPADLSVVGFDNVPEAIHCDPPLTTVDQQPLELGRQATELLIDLIQGKAVAAGPHRVPTRLVIRASCGPSLQP